MDRIAPHVAAALFAFAVATPAQSTQSAGPAAPDQRGAAMACLRQLSTAEKAGQLFVSWIRADDGRPAEQARLEGLVRDVGLGGVILSIGGVGEAAALVTRLQGAAKVPLLCAGDFEGGVAFRFHGAAELGNQMLVGATRQTRLARAMGEITGREAKALGVPWVFAPVLDVNTNADNPIINVRSFGEDPQLVARLGAAFAAGVRAAGAMPCGKHFPGHGDVSSDSHLALPTVPGDVARLHAVELVPFALAAHDGLESVMTGHLAVPGLGEDPAVPATLSRHILGDVLRGELGFTGLIVTDALDMGGVKNALAPGEVAVRALLAGADVLLMPPDPLAARDAVVAAVAAGRVPMARLDDAVLRLLQAKERVGLLAAGLHGPAADWQASVDRKDAQELGTEIAARGVTLVRDPRGLVPLAMDRTWTLLEVFDQDASKDDEVRRPVEFGPALAAAGVQLAPTLRVTGDSDVAAVAAAAAAIAGSDRVVLALHVRVRAYAGSIGLPPAVQPVIDALGSRPVVAIAFGNPYLAQRLPQGASYLCAFRSSYPVGIAVAAILGGAPALGRLPVAIPGVAPAGTGLTPLRGTDVPRGDPVREGVDPQLGADIRQLLVAAIAERAFPGAVCAVARHGELLFAEAVGRYGYADDDTPVAVETRYDLASLTKVCATLPAVLTLVAAGRLGLDDLVQKWLPEFVGTGKDRVTVRHLLAHTGGLPAYERYYRTLQGRDAIVAAAAAEGLMTEPGERVVYSDLGLVLMMAIVERCSGEPFSAYVESAVWRPLGMRGACFAPTTGAPVDAPPTEDSGERGGLVRGRVHDENAFAMGGVSGHAGMFATADDVLRLGLCFLGRGRGVVPPTLVDAALLPQRAVGSNRAVGLDLLQPGGFGGARLSPGPLGHTGFTGTSLLCDPQRDVCVVLLTNRVHPTRVNGRIAAVRQRLHDLVLGACE